MPAQNKIFDAQKIRRDFPNLQRKIKGKPLVYLDNAATTLKPQCVIDTLEHYYSQATANVHRGIHTLSQEATALYEDSREKIRDFINARSVQEIIFTSGTTDAINLVAQTYGRKNFKSGDEILISEMEHHSNIVPWQMLCEENGCTLKIIPINDAGEIIFEEFKKLLSEKTKLISIVYISNSLGTINPIEDIIREARKFNTVVLIDGAQAISHFPVDVQKLDCDFFVFSGHKLFGPTGTGVLYGKQQLLDAMPPYKGGGDMISNVTFAKTTYNILPYKFEAGTPHIAGFIGLGAAVDYVRSISLESVAAHKKELLDYGTQKLLEIDGIRIIGTAKNKTSILSFIHPTVHAHDLGTLVDEEGVAVRTGHHCTQPVMEHFGITATSRASLSIYNTKEELDTLVRAIKNAISIFQ